MRYVKSLSILLTNHLYPLHTATGFPIDLIAAVDWTYRLLSQIHTIHVLKMPDLNLFQIYVNPTTKNAMPSKR